jgi:putrescine transport system permease protein
MSEESSSFELTEPRRRPWAIYAPMIWMVIFFAMPFVMVIKISFSQTVLARPPYLPVFDFTLDGAQWMDWLAMLSLESYQGLFNDPLYLDSYLSSLRLAGLATIVCLLIAYPFALSLARLDQRWRSLFFGLAVAPFCTSFLIRVYAWIAILKDEGFLNHLLIWLGVIDEPLQIFATDAAVLIGIVYSYLPFMILPIYVAIERQDHSLLEAAADLGAHPWSAFWRVTFPLSLPGVIAGSLLVFIPAIGEFVIPDLLGGSQTLMIGHTIWVDFFDNRDWPSAAAAAVVLLALLLLPIWAYEKLQSNIAREGL